MYASGSGRSRAFPKRRTQRHLPCALVLVLYVSCWIIASKRTHNLHYDLEGSTLLVVVLFRTILRDGAHYIVTGGSHGLARANFCIRERIRITLNGFRFYTRAESATAENQTVRLPKFPATRAEGHNRQPRCNYSGAPSTISCHLKPILLPSEGPSTAIILVCPRALP